MKIDRCYSVAGTDPFSLFEYDQYDLLTKHHDTGEVLLDIKGCEVPRHWSKNARNILISKYFRKGGVPADTVKVDITTNCQVPYWLRPSQPTSLTTTGGEISIKQVIGRIVGHWTYTGFQNGYFDPPADQIYNIEQRDGCTTAEAGAKALEENASAYYDEMIVMMLKQAAAPNSPQWFNTGLWWAYGITGPAQGHSFVDLPHKLDQVGKGDAGFKMIYEAEVLNGDKSRADNLLAQCVQSSPNAYERIQAHACFILSVEDSMMGSSGILDWYQREALIFKYGSGAGANVSKLRSKREYLSGGGKSSGVMSWVEVADRSAGAIKSGGTTRRAAKMVRLDLDHPDILDFVNSKVESEVAVASMVAGNALIHKYCQRIIDVVRTHCVPLPTSVREALDREEVACEIADAQDRGVCDNYIHKAIQFAMQGVPTWPRHILNADFDSRAYQIAPFQNANHSVGVPSIFYEACDKDNLWGLSNRTDGRVIETPRARDLETAIAQAAWFCGDPGMQFDTIINDWNVTPKDGRISSSNPCSEHLRLPDSACNLASLNLMSFLMPGGFDIGTFRHAVRLWQITLDITNTMAHLPSRQVAINVFNYRDTGLGYGNLGALLMAMGLPYDSDRGRALAGALTALLQGQCHLTSAEMAGELGAYPRFRINREDHLRCLRNHLRAVDDDDASLYEGLTVPPCPLHRGDLQQATGTNGFYQVLHDVWHEAYRAAVRHGLRNAEMTVIAPTGTIGFVMDCDTTGVEPLLGLKVFKQLVGGGKMEMTAASVGLGLKRLGCSPAESARVVACIEESGMLPADFSHPEYREVFATSLSRDENLPAIAWQAHIKMMAAVQTFVSGAISKTVNMPLESTIEDMRDAYRMGHDCGCKAVALYRDGSKLSQPLTIAAPKKPTNVAMVADTPVTDGLGTPSTSDPVRDVIKAGGGTVSPMSIKSRTRLGWYRKPGIDVAVEIGFGRLYLRTTRYDDEAVAEIWATYSADQGIVQALLDTLCKTANLALQSGVPLAWIVDSWMGSKFEPNGIIGGHPFIKNCTSIVNLMARLLEYHELGETGNLNMLPKSDPAQSTDLPTSGSTLSGVKITGEQCPGCGRADQYVQSGAGCKKCLRCGESGGCG